MWEILLNDVSVLKGNEKLYVGLKCCLSNEIYSNEFERFESCFDVIWHCAENLPYFDNPDNPAADIYLQLVKKYHCPKSPESTPHTLTELKIYWQLLDTGKTPLIQTIMSWLQRTILESE